MDLLAQRINLLWRFNGESRGLLFSHSEETSRHLSFVVIFLRFHFRRVHYWSCVPDGNLTAASVIRAHVFLGDLDIVRCVHWDELSADLILEKCNFTEPSFRRKEAGGFHIKWHLEGEWELEFADLALILVGCQVEQVDVLPMDDSIVSVLQFRIFAMFNEDSML